MILNILIGIFTGIISGWYTGFAMAKYSAFCQIRSEIIYICRNLSVTATNGEIDGFSFEKYYEIDNLASNFLYLKHKDAGNAAFKLCKDIRNIQMKLDYIIRCRRANQPICSNEITAEEVFIKMQEWQVASRKLTPSKVVIFVPWGHL